MNVWTLQTKLHLNIVFTGNSALFQANAEKSGKGERMGFVENPAVVRLVGA